MGHKTTPNLFRLGTTKTWNSRWFADTKQYKNFIYEDVLVREFLKKKLDKHFVDRIEIERDGKKMSIVINTAKPGVVIGKSGMGVDELKNAIAKMLNLKEKKLNIDVIIKEFKNSDLSASILAEQARLDVERRIPFKKVMKKIIDKAKQAGAKGVKVSMAGRLNGVEIARRETLGWGSIPLHTLRADIDYVNDRAQTIYGSIGIKVWVYKGLVFNDNQKIEEEKKERPERPAFQNRQPNSRFQPDRRVAPRKLVEEKKEEKVVVKDKEEVKKPLKVAAKTTVKKTEVKKTTSKVSTKK